MAKDTPAKVLSRYITGRIPQTSGRITVEPAITNGMAKVNGLEHVSIPFKQLLEEEPANAVKSKLDTCAKGTHIFNFDYTSWGWEKHALISYVDTRWYWSSCSVLRGKPVVNQSMNQLAKRSLTPTRHFGFLLLFLLAFVPGQLAVQCHDDSASLIYEQGGRTIPSLCINPWHDNLTINISYYPFWIWKGLHSSYLFLTSKLRKFSRWVVLAFGDGLCRVARKNETIRTFADLGEAVGMARSTQSGDYEANYIQYNRMHHDSKWFVSHGL